MNNSFKTYKDGVICYHFRPKEVKHKRCSPIKLISEDFKKVREYLENSAKENKTEEKEMGHRLYDEERERQDNEKLNFTDFISKENEYKGYLDPSSPSYNPQSVIIFKLADKLKEEKAGKKETENKVDYSEINLDILDLMAERIKANKHKYPHGNSLKPMNIKDLEQALFRHVKKLIQRKETDEETYEQHLSAILCNASFILTQLQLKND